MNSHHLKQPPQMLNDRVGYKMVVHDLIVNRLGLTPFSPQADSPYIDAAKDGRFHQSSCAVGLYSNAFTKKAAFPSDLAPFGYINKRHGDLFSFGVYRRSDGLLFGSLLPLSSNVQSMAEFTRIAMAELPIAGIYIRFLRIPQYARLVSDFGFKPAKEEPWLPDAPEEDESLSHSRVDLSRLFTPNNPMPVYQPLRRNVNRARNYLNRVDMDYRLVPLTAADLPVAMDIVRMHFEMIERRGKLVGSTYEDYLGLLNPDILSLKSVTAHLGLLGTLPVSVFITEGNGNMDDQPCVSGYAGITLRNINYLLGSSKHIAPLEIIGRTDRPEIGDPSENLSSGSSALPTYAFAKLFSLSFFDGYRYFYMGGSEHADIDTWKRKQMGAEKDPTYWVVYTKP
jgi:hypothetical protein